MSLTFPVRPMKAVLGTLPADDDAWAYEFKWDGFRTIVFVDGASARLQSSSGHDVTSTYPHLSDLTSCVAVRKVILDGELVVLDESGRPRFELMQRAPGRAVFFPFDVLSLEGRDTIGLPYEHRRRLLTEAVDDGPFWKVHEHQIGDGKGLLEVSRTLGLEGVMAKRLGSSYQPGRRSPSWRKVKNRIRASLMVGGYTAGSGARSGTFGALLVGVKGPNDKLRFAGGVGSGFTHKRLAQLTAELRRLEQAACPFDPTPPRPYITGARWVRPELTVTVELTEWTNDGLVRQASYVDPSDASRR